jgi:hypothetical protein
MSSSPADLPEAALLEPRPWWLRLGDEGPEPTVGCPAADCDTADMTAVDVYCRTHERFLPWVSDTPGRLRPVGVNLVRAAVCGAFVLTASLDSALPVALVGVGVGAAVVALPLRRYPTGVRFVNLLWAVGCVLAALWWAAGGRAHPTGWPISGSRRRPTAMPRARWRRRSR